MNRSIPSRIAGIVPALDWLRGDQAGWLRGDLVAGITLAAYLMPAAGLSQGFPTSGGMSQSLVNESSGARSPLSGFISSLLILGVILFLSGMLRHLPQPVLAAIVLVAVTGLFKISALKQIWRFSCGEFAVAIAALAGVLLSGLLMGVLIGVILSILLLLRSAMQPPTTELGRVPGTDYFAERIRHPSNERLPGVFIFRCDGGILYFNVEHVSYRFSELLTARPDAVKLAVFFMGTVPMIDLAGVEFLTELRESLYQRGIDLRLAEAHNRVREALRRGGFEQHYGPVEVINRWLPFPWHREALDSHCHLKALPAHSARRKKAPYRILIHIRPASQPSFREPHDHRSFPRH